jgi:hypothetical protein
VCLLARVAEEKGISTVVLSGTRDIMLMAKPPRGVFVNFPLHHPLGRPLDIGFQMKVLKDTVNALTEITDPGKIKDLPYRWLENDFSWQDRLDAIVCYLDKRKSHLLNQKIWYDAEGKAHRKNEYTPVPGWTSDWEGK